jgi:hypothetical protein
MNARRFLQFVLKAYRPVQQRGLWMDGVLPPRHAAPTRGARVKTRRPTARPVITSISQKEALA